MREYAHPMFDDTGKVICQICGKPFMVISPPHLKKHNVKYADYKNRFPNAPLSNEEFAARGRFGKNKDMFATKDAIGDEIIVEDPYVEEFDIQEALKQEIKDPISAAKYRILDQLRITFANVEMDYMINHQDPISQIIQFSFITDFCDPVLRVVIDFPDTFWHNHEMHVDANRDRKLEAVGWVIIKVPTNAPTFEMIARRISQL